MRKNPLENDFELELCRLGDYHADDVSGQESRRRPPISATLRESVPREEALLSHAFEHEVADGSALAAEPSGAGVAQVSGRMCERVEAVPLGAGEAGVGAGVLTIGLAARVGDEPGGPLVAAGRRRRTSCPPPLPVTRSRRAVQAVPFGSPVIVRGTRGRASSSRTPCLPGLNSRFNRLELACSSNSSNLLSLFLCWLLAYQRYSA